MNDQTRRGYPLGALFVLVAASAVLVAGVTPLIRLTVQGKVEASSFLFALALGAGVGLNLGILIGLHRYRRAAGVLVGACVGTVIGGIGGLMALLPPGQVPAAAAAMVAGSGLVVGVALVMRRAKA